MFENLIQILYNYVSNAGSVLNTEHSPTTYPNEFYYLSLIYENDTWSIHGLWPQYNDGKYPSFCKEVEFDINALQPIIDRLNVEWCSDIGSNDDFWEHEWKKHGSCMFCENMTEFQYFNKALELFEQVKKEDNIIEKYKKGTNKSMIPFDLNFNLLNIL